MKREHELKCWPEFFQALHRDDKTFEARKNDRGFKVGDVLYLREWNPDTGKYTGDGMRRVVTYILDDPAFGVQPGWVIMGLSH